VSESSIFCMFCYRVTDSPIKMGLIEGKYWEPVVEDRVMSGRYKEIGSICNNCFIKSIVKD
jgi:hypothetical protein